MAIAIFVVVHDRTPLIPRDEYAILDATLDVATSPAEVHPFFLNRSSFVPSEIPDRSWHVDLLLEKTPDLDRAVIESFYENNAVAHRLTRRFSSRFSYIRANKVEAQQIVQVRGIAEPRWITLSRPGVNASNDVALVYILAARGGLNWGTYFIVLERSGTVWRYSQIIAVN